MAEVTGFAAPGFERVRDAFAGNFDDRGPIRFRCGSPARTAAITP